MASYNPNKTSSTEALEELTSNGTGSGLESEIITEDEVDINVPFDPKKIDVVTQMRTVDLLMSRLEHGELDLSPNFQRRANLWRDSQKSGLIESMLLRIPIPSLYVSEDKDGNYQVVDGLQRLCAIAHFVKVSSLNKSLKSKLAPLRLTGLQSLKDELNGMSFDDLPRPLQRRITETELTLHIIRAGTPPNVKFNIFSRINQGGLPLKAQEIRNAIYPGIWREHIETISESSQFLSSTQNKIKGERLEDHELILRFAALYTLPKGETRNPEENLDDFLNNFVEKRSAGWSSEKWQSIEEAFYKAMIAAPKVFKRVAFRKYSYPNESLKPINRGLFESEAVALALRTPNELKILEERSKEVLSLLADAHKNNDNFISSLLYATGRGWASNKRLEVLNGIFDEVLNA